MRGSERCASCSRPWVGAGRTAAERDAGRAISTAMLRRQEALAEAELAWLGTFRSAIGKIRR